MTDELTLPEEPLPQAGGSYRRQSDGSLIPVEGPLAQPETQPAQE